MKKSLSILLALVILISSFSSISITAYAASPSCTSLKSSNITTSSARIDFQIKNPSRLKITTCGMQIRKKGTSSWSTKSETIGSSYQKNSSIPVWYTIGKGKEFNITLSAGTKYEYRGFCKYNGKTYYTSTGSFTTKNNITMPSCTSLKSSNITTSSARIDFQIKNPSCLKIKTCGMQIRKKGTSSWSTKSETIGSSYQNNSSIPVWYTIGKGQEFTFSLSANTTYEYRGFCKYNDKTYYTSTATFTTAKVSSTSSLSSSKLNALKKKYPEGSSWNSSKAAYGGQGCYAYAMTAFNYVYGKTATRVKTGLNKTTAWDNIKVGDVVHYQRSKSDPDYKYGYYDKNGKWISEHWVFVTAKSSTNLTVAEGNYGKGVVHYGRTISKTKFTNGNYYNIEIRR